MFQASGQADIFDRSSGQTDLWSDVAPISEASGQVDIFFRSSGQADLWSDIHPAVRLQVTLIFFRSLGQADLWSDVPPGSEASGQVDIFSDHWVRLTFGQMYCPHQ